MTNDEDEKRAEEWAKARNTSYTCYDCDSVTSLEANAKDIYLAGIEEGRRLRWIKCSERMPNDGQIILGWDKSIQDFLWVQFEDNAFRGDAGQDYGAKEGIISHWAEIEKPEGEK